MLRAYVTNLGKYNEGQLVGKWVDLPLEEDLKEVLQSIGVGEEPDQNGQYYEEYFITDWESDDLDAVADTLGEYENLERLSELLERVEDAEVLNAYIKLVGGDLEKAIERCNDGDVFLLEGIYTDYDLGYYWIEESGCYDLSFMGNLSNYFDYESFGRDVRLESEGGFVEAGWLEID